MPESDQVEDKHKIPGSISQVFTVVKFELLNYFRARRFYVLLAITLIIGVLLTAVVGYYQPESYISTEIGNGQGFYYNWWGMWIPIIIVLAGIFFGGDAISGEFQNKTGYFLVPNPIRRVSIYVGKWLATLTASLLILGVYAAITVANAYYYFPGKYPPYQFGESVLFAILFLISVLGFTFFFSSLFKSSSISILLTAILFLFVFNLLDTLVAALAQIEPWFILTYGSEIIQSVLSDPYRTTITTPAGPRGRSFTLFAPTINEGLAIMAVYFLATAILGLVIFERREFT